MSRVPPDVLIDVRLRENNNCAVCGLKIPGIGHVHHRQPRGMGGSSARNTMSNLIYLHPTCHLIHVENNRERAYDNGWLVRSGDDPAQTPLRYMLDRTVLLDDNGNITETEGAS